MPTTTNFSLRYPASTGAADGPTAFQNLANDTDAAIETQANAIAALNGQYSRTMTISRSVADSTYTQVTAPTTVNQNNVPVTNPFTSGQFTAWKPMLVAVTLAAQGVLSAGRTTVRIQLNGNQIVAADTSNGAQGSATASLVWWLHTGDTIDYWFYQNSGGSVTMTGFASIAQIG